MPKYAVIILAEGFEDVEAVTPIDLLRRAGIDVTVAGLSAMEIRSAHKLWFKADIDLESYAGTFDALVLPGGMPGTLNLLESNHVIRMVQMAYSDGKLCAAICAASRVFHKTGILKGKKFTCFPGTEEMIDSGTWIEQDVVRDGNLITSRAVGTAIAFSLEIIDYLLGEEKAREIAGKIVYKWSR